MWSVRLALAVVGLAMFTGCFEFSQEIWIREDRTGRVRMAFGISETLVAFGRQSGEDPLEDIRQGYAEAKVKLEAHPNVTTCTVEEYSENGLHYLALDVEVEDAAQLEDEEFIELISQQTLFGNASTGEMQAPDGALRFARLPNGNVEFSHVISTDGVEGAPPAAPPPDPNDPFADMGETMGRAMLAGMFGDRAITVTLHAPKIVSANGQLNAERTTVVWRIPLVEMMEGGPFRRELRAEFEPPARPLNWLLFAAVGMIGVMIVVVAATRARRGRLRRAPEGEA